MYYKEEWASNYINELSCEIKSNYKNELIDTLYIGGGTPNSLNNCLLEQLLKELSKIRLNKNYEYTIECNIELLTIEQIELFKKYGINRVSLGVQTINEKYLKFLNRNHTKEEVKEKIELLKNNGITNINIDLIYAIPNETIEELSNDLDFIKSLNIPHVSTYSLMIEPNTVLYNNKVSNIDEEVDYNMYNYIINELNNYKHYETSNFAKEGFESRHNLNYWNNDHYYGFGLGASGYIDNIRYDNTRSINKYLNKEYCSNKNYLSKNETIENEFILGFRKINGINIDDFNSKYNLNVLEIPIVKELLEREKLIINDRNIMLNKNYLYIANEILIDFLGVDYEK